MHSRLKGSGISASKAYASEVCRLGRGLQRPTRENVWKLLWKQQSVKRECLEGSDVPHSSCSLRSSAKTSDSSLRLIAQTSKLTAEEHRGFHIGPPRKPKLCNYLLRLLPLPHSVLIHF